MMRIRHTAAAVVFALAAAACGGDDGASSADAPDTAATVTAVPGADDTTSTEETVEAAVEECANLANSVLIGWTPLLSFFPVAWAADAGYFADEGLDDVEFVEFTGGSVAAAAMLSGSVQFILTSAERPLLLAEEAGSGTKNVQAMTNASDMAVVARDGVGIEAGDIDSLRGKSIGITAAGGGFDKTLRLLLTENGIDPDSDVDILEVGGVSTAVAAVRAGQIDAVMYSEPAVAQLLELDGTFVVAALADDFPEVAQLSFAGMQTTDDFIADNECVVEAIVRGASRAANELAQLPQPEAAIEAVLAQFGGETPDSVLIAAFERMATVYDPRVSQEQAANTVNAMEREGTIPEGKFGVDDFVAFQFSELWETGR